MIFFLNCCLDHFIKALPAELPLSTGGVVKISLKKERRHTQAEDKTKLIGLKRV
jgi:hypothetical protein